MIEDTKNIICDFVDLVMPNLTPYESSFYVLLLKLLPVLRGNRQQRQFQPRPLCTSVQGWESLKRKSPYLLLGLQRHQIWEVFRRSCPSYSQEYAGAKTEKERINTNGPVVAKGSSSSEREGTMSGTLLGAPRVAEGIFPNCATAFDTQGSEPYGRLR